MNKTCVLRSHGSILAFLLMLSIYLYKVSNYMEIFSGSEACLVDIAIMILLYIDDILLISVSFLQKFRHLDALKSFCRDNDLLGTLIKVK